MEFTPVSDEQLAQEAEERERKAAPWKAGEYDFEILQAEETTSKIKPDGSGGNPMIVLETKVYNGEDFKTINDYLLTSNMEKLKRAAYAVGLGKDYENGKLSAYDFQGRSGTLTLRIKRQVGYKDKNEISGYIVSGKNADAYASTLPRPELDDEIPF